MDSRIESLKFTTFCGHRLTRRQIADVQETVAPSPALSGNEPAKTVCEHLNWPPKGGYRIAACLRMLERLEECRILTLSAEAEHGPRAQDADPPHRALCPQARDPWRPSRVRAAVPPIGDGEAGPRQLERSGLTGTMASAARARSARASAG